VSQSSFSNKEEHRREKEGRKRDRIGEDEMEKGQQGGGNLILMQR
jgi:hypothetical protein